MVPTTSVCNMVRIASTFALSISCWLTNPACMFAYVDTQQQQHQQQQHPAEMSPASGTMIHPNTYHPPNLLAKGDLLSNPMNDVRWKAPTESQPQIQLSDEMQRMLKERWMNQGAAMDSRNSRDGRQGGASTSTIMTEDNALLQGLVYLDDTLKSAGVYSLDPDDFIVVTATVFHDDVPPSDNDPVVMGAKVKVGKVRIPMQFKLFKENILAHASENEPNWETSDMVLTAKVCSPGLDRYPCSSNESKFISRGIAKRIIIPGTDGIYIWTPASLPFQKKM